MQKFVMPRRLSNLPRVLHAHGFKTKRPVRCLRDWATDGVFPAQQNAYGWWSFNERDLPQIIAALNDRGALEAIN